MKWNYIVEILSVQLIIYSVLHNAFKGRLKKAFALCPLITLAFVVVLEISDYNELVLFVFQAVLYFIMPQVLVNDMDKKLKRYISLLCVGVVSVIVSLPIFVCSLINTNIIPAVCNALYIGLGILIFALTFCKRLTNKVGMPIISILSASKSTGYLLLVFVWMLFAMINFLSVLLTVRIHPTVLAMFSCLLILMVILSFAVFFKLIFSTAQSMYYKKLNGMIEASVAEQVRHYNRMNSANESLRKFRHDFKNLKIGLAYYIKNNDFDGAADYLETCSEIADTDCIFYSTGNPVVNSLISDKALQVKANNISIEFDGIIPQDALTPADLCITFGNAIDNAIEACLKIEDDVPKIICIAVRQKGGFLFISITNPICENVDIKGNNIVSTKSDRTMHGIGLYSIKSVVRKYDGHLNLSCDNNIFTIDFDFCLPERQSENA